MSTLILDYSFARPSPASIKAAGYTGVMRYLSTTPGTKPNPKDLSVVEAVALHAVGLSIGLVWETTATRAGQGRAAGASDAANAEAEADALGYPSGCPIFYAVDFDAAPNVVAAYFAGVVSKAHRPVGVYGSKRVVEGINVPYRWQACAWSGGLVSAGAHLYQRLKATVPSPIGGTDENIVLHDFPMWTNAPAPVRPTVTQPSRSQVRPLISTRNIPMTVAIQKAVHVTADGKWGNGTQAAASAVIRRDLANVPYLQGWVGVKEDGAWGPISEGARVAAVKHIQSAIGVTPDGAWGPLSARAWATAVTANLNKF